MPQRLSSVSRMAPACGFPYGWLGICRHIPSEGLLIKFSGDLVYLVLIRGSNLDRGIDGKAIDLIRGGLHRHHVVWLREMRPKEKQTVADTEPSIDRIEVGAFETHEALKDWVGKRASAFAQESS